ncbi:MAG TPA: class I SAM-dependent methyltransferase [Anaeromyxobacteraceae bacterium]|nr:class I SAM-dependent methyltransferase [Anaeromyxobacteraceae bacterium]
MDVQPRKAWKGMAMEGRVADWYAKNTGKDLRRFEAAAHSVTARVATGARVLEVAPGPGYLALELARRGYRVTGLDVSRSFMRIARENAARAGLNVDFREGDAAHLPLPDAAFDHAVCLAAFKNFSDPLGALDELHRVLVPGGTASILDLRRDVLAEAIAEEVKRMRLSRWNGAVTRFTFRFMLVPRAYPRDALESLAARSRFGRGELVNDGIGFELRLTKAA